MNFLVVLFTILQICNSEEINELQLLISRSTNFDRDKFCTLNICLRCQEIVFKTGDSFKVLKFCSSLLNIRHCCSQFFLDNGNIIGAFSISCVSYIEGCIPECPLINSPEEIQILVDPESEIDDILSSENLDDLLIGMQELEQCEGDSILTFALVGMCFIINIICICIICIYASKNPGNKDHYKE